jgi:NAD(P)-dependent dehydrogenase (short-subunit alcohol dehydrogenase family)
MFDKTLFAGRYVLITGGGSGLGRSMALRLAELGADIAICGRREDVLDEAVAALAAATGRDCARRFACDIRDAAQVEAMLDRIWADRPLDALINNAAGNFIARSETLSPRAVDAVLNVVAHGSAYVTLGCGRRWLDEGRAASVLTIATTYAETGSAYVVPSAMGKAALVAMTRSLAVEWGGRGIRLNAVAPGPFPTAGAWERLVPRADLAARFETNNPLGRAGRHEELADLAAFLLSPAAGYINGEVVTIDGGEWLQGAGQFNFLSELTDDEWEAIKPSKAKPSS